MAKIQASIAILAKNSAKTLPRALKSVSDFSEVIIADGDSRDETREIAHTYGARVITQDLSFLDAGGAIVDFAGVRNQCIQAASNDWIFFLDSDEYISEELPEEIRTIAGKRMVGAYWVPRRYIFKGSVIERSISYPNRQIRFFHKSAGYGFRKPIHERFEPNPSVSVQHLRNPILVPVDPDLDALRVKNDRYIELEIQRLSPMTFRKLLNISFSSVKLFVLYTLRFLRVFFLENGTRLPLPYELLVFRYRARLSFQAFLSFLHLTV